MFWIFLRGSISHLNLLIRFSLCPFLFKYIFIKLSFFHIWVFFYFKFLKSSGVFPISFFARYSTCSKVEIFLLPVNNETSSANGILQWYVTSFFSKICLRKWNSFLWEGEIPWIISVEPLCLFIMVYLVFLWVNITNMFCGSLFLDTEFEFII